MIVCLCRGKSEKDVLRAIEAGASTVTELQRCGIGDQCGGCHVSLRSMLAAAAAAAPLAQEPLTAAPAPQSVHATA